MDFDLSEDQQAFQNIAKEFSRKELAPNAAEWDAKGEFPVEVIKKAGGLGFCSLYGAEEDGGMGLGKIARYDSEYLQ
mgnify:CR=1 FL=1